MESKFLKIAYSTFKGFLFYCYAFLNDSNSIWYHVWTFKSQYTFWKINRKLRKIRQEKKGAKLPLLFGVFLHSICFFVYSNTLLHFWEQSLHYVCFRWYAICWFPRFTDLQINSIFILQHKLCLNRENEPAKNIWIIAFILDNHDNALWIMLQAMV